MSAGKYFYARYHKYWRIWKREGDEETAVEDHFFLEDARKRVYELNGWTRTNK